MSTMCILVFLSSCALQRSSCTHISGYFRRILHQPFLPLSSIPPAPSPSPISPPKTPQPQMQPPKPPFSCTPAAAGSNNSFFPSVLPPPSPFATTFPANISSHVLPQPSSPRKPISIKLLTSVAAVVSSITLVLILTLIFYYQRHRRHAAGKASRSDSLRLYPANSTTSDSVIVGHKPLGGGASGASSEFLYLGSMVNFRGPDGNNKPSDLVISLPPLSAYQKLGSPELRPLPPLPRQNVSTNNPDKETSSSLSNDDDQHQEEEEFYSPRGSSACKERVFQVVKVENFGSRCFNSPTPSYPSSNSTSPTHSTFKNSPSPPLNSISRSSNSESLYILKLQRPPVRPPPPQPGKTPCFLSSPASLLLERDSPIRISDFSIESTEKSPERMTSACWGQEFHRKAPPPPSPHPSGYCEEPAARVVNTISGPPALIAPSMPIMFPKAAPLVPLAGLYQNPESLAKSEDTPKPKLKPLHWKKVRASSDRDMVWDKLKSSSFKLNEEMMETLFVVNGSGLAHKDNVRQAVLLMPNQENQVLDPKKSQNIAILLRALNVTIDEVCEALLEGNANNLGTELLESLLEMAPTNEEERKLKELRDETSFKLCPSERFLRAVIDIPYAFKRVDAMLYIANFDSEVGYLQISFKTLEAACEELRNSRMFLKLLEAVLKTGNRMNVGTNRGDAHAFKLDTLLKLVDVKGADGKTTLLHFVVQEIIKAEGSCLSGPNQNQTDDKTRHSALWDDMECRKLGLEVVSSLSGELTNVKKAAVMDSDVLGNNVGKLAAGITRVREIVKLIKGLALEGSSQSFCQSMQGFLHKAKEELVRIEAQESVALALVEELTGYFHGNSAMEETQPFRIFKVVRDFLSTLDNVCKEVGKINGRTLVSSRRQFPQPINPGMQPPALDGFGGRYHYIPSGDESSSSS